MLTEQKGWKSAARAVSFTACTWNSTMSFFLYPQSIVWGSQCFVVIVCLLQLLVLFSSTKEPLRCTELICPGPQCIFMFLSKGSNTVCCTICAKQLWVVMHYTDRSTGMSAWLQRFIHPLVSSRTDCEAAKQWILSSPGAIYSSWCP